MPPSHEEFQLTWEQNQELLERTNDLQRQVRALQAREHQLLAELESLQGSRRSVELDVKREQLDSAEHRLDVAQKRVFTLEHERDDALRERDDMKRILEAGQKACSSLRAEHVELQRHCQKLHGVAQELNSSLEAEQRECKHLRHQAAELEALLESSRQSNRYDDADDRPFGEMRQLSRNWRESNYSVTTSSTDLSLEEELACCHSQAPGIEFFTFATSETMCRSKVPSKQKAASTQGRLKGDDQAACKREERESLALLARKDRAIKRLRKQLEELKEHSPEETGTLGGIVDSVLFQLKDLTKEGAGMASYMPVNTLPIPEERQRPRRDKKPEGGGASSRPSPTAPTASMLGRAGASPATPARETKPEVADAAEEAADTRDALPQNVSQVRVRLQERRERLSKLMGNEGATTMRRSVLASAF